MKTLKTLFRTLAGFAAVFLLSAAQNAFATVTVTITNPANGALYATSPIFVEMTATASATGGYSISKMEFFDGSTLLGTDTTSPYSTYWFGGAAGVHTLTAKATATKRGNPDQFGTASINVTVNAYPSISITNPAPNAIFNPPANVTVSADATDSDGTVTRVEFFLSTTSIGIDTTAPYSADLSNLPSGMYSVRANATDNLGALAGTDYVSFIVNALPTVSITSPTANATFNAPASITLLASAADSDGYITQVEFFANGMSIGVDTTVDKTTPYTINWTNVAAGTYSLSAVATDNQGQTTTSVTVPIMVNAAPSVSITSPANNATFNAPANITITASAQDTDGTINRVELYANSTLIATLTAAPYTFDWTNVAAGTYALTAKAIDNNNAETLSAPVSITVRTVSTLYFIHVDHLNTPRLVADATGTTVWRWDQAEPFGNNVPDENPSGLGAFDLPLRFPGQYYDRETALHYNAARNYDASIGRYEESDLIGLKGGLNTYAYAHSDPLRLSDPSGLAVWLCIRATSFRIGNHSYFYDDKTRQCCGYPGWNYDHPLQNCPDRARGPGVDSCTLISSNDDDAKQLFTCCQKKANPYTYFPTWNDCQDLTDDCIREIGMAPPQTRSRGRWMACDTCWRRP